MTDSQERIISSLIENGGEMFQTDIVRAANLSKSRTSEILSSLEKRHLVSRLQQGRNYRVSVNGTRGSGLHRKHLRLGFTRAAEFPFIIPFRKLMRHNHEIEIDLRIYENGLDVARDLSLLKLDLGIAPILMSFMYCSLGAPFRLIAPAGSGGSYVVTRESPGKKSMTSEPIIATTKLSTMELLLKSSVLERILPQDSREVYADNPESIMRGIYSKKFDAACIWEPYATMLAKKCSVSKIVDYAQIGEHLCCALSAGNHMNDSHLLKIRESLRKAINDFEKEKDQFLQQYSALTGFDYRLIRDVAHEYSYPPELDPKLISRQFERAGILTPRPSTVRDMIWRAG